MRQVKIEYENFERDENKAMVAEMVLAYSFLFPVWLKVLTVSVYDRHTESEFLNGWSSGNPKYGTAEIGIRTKFFEKPTQWQRELVVHEMVHIAHMRLDEYIHDRLLAQVKERNEELHAFLEDDMHERIEEFTEHMALGIVEALSLPTREVPADAENAKTWRPEEFKRLPAVPEHKPLATVGHRRGEGDRP